VQRHYETILTEAQLDHWLTRLDAAPLVALDTETTSLDEMRAELVGISFAIEPDRAAYLPLAHRYTGAPPQLDRAAALEKLRPWLEAADKPKLGQNLKYDMHVFANYGITVRGVVHDTLLESFVFESHKPHDMDSLARRHLDVTTITYDDVTGKGASRIGFEQVAVERATEYSGEDADVTLQLHQALYPAIEADEKLLKVYRDIELPVLDVLFTMERNGVLLDINQLVRLSHEFGMRMAEFEAAAHDLAGQPSTDEDVLQRLALDYPLPKKILEYRALSKLKSTYTDKLPRMVGQRRGRVHTHYAQAGAATGRLASSDPNLQNIPVRTADGRRIREAFIASPGSRIVSADYSQVELRIMAHISQDASLLAAFAAGHDIHRATAAEIFNVAAEQIDAEQRRYAKVINFGLIYGMSAFGLASQIGIDRAAAQQYMDRYFARYPGVADYMQRTREQARERGYVETIFGRRLWLADIRAGGGPRRQAAERAAINAPMQGTAADLIKLAMAAVQHWLERRRLGAKLIMQVHDELVLEVPENELDEVKVQLPALMSGVAKLDVPLVVDVGVGANWDEAH
jgi:DNA polymerase-1